MRGRLSREDGFTLPEMMVTIIIMIAVFFALHNIFDMSMRIFSFGNDTVEAVENARVGLERMEREIRAAFPYDKGASPPNERLFATPLQPTRITFGNDLDGNHVINQSTEEITHSLSTAGPPYTLQRSVGSGGAQDVMEHVGNFDDGSPGLRFDYLKRSGTDLVATSTESEVEVVRITVLIDKDGRRQELTTDVDLRSRS